MKKITKYLKNNKKVAILLVTNFLLFILLSFFVVTEKTSYIDSLVHSYIISIRTDNLTSILTTITNLAGASFMLALSVILFIVIKNKKIPGYIFINLAIAFITNETVKNIFNRSRPIGINLIEETGLSFPSGHSMVSLSFYGFILYLLCKSQKSKSKKVFYIICFTLGILLIGFSRIYLGVHYLTDVIGGFLLSIIYLTLFIKCVQIEKK